MRRPCQLAGIFVFELVMENYAPLAQVTIALKPAARKKKVNANRKYKPLDEIDIEGKRGKYFIETVFPSY